MTLDASSLSMRMIRVVLAADTVTREPRTLTPAYDELCNACENITDDELATLRHARDVQAALERA